MAFAHLHVHTEYSLLDGACRMERLLDAAKEMGGTLEEMYTVTFDGQPAGYAVKLTASGSQGLIEMVIGVDAEQKITGISVVNHSETSGIGTKVCGNKPMTTVYPFWTSSLA